MKRVKTHATYANVVATLALIVAIAGGSTAIAVSSKVKKNAVGTKQLKNGSVTADKLAPSAVKPGKISPGAVGASELANGSVVTEKIAPQAVRAAQIANAQVTASKLAGVHVPSATGMLVADASCDSGEKMLGGGGFTAGGSGGPSLTQSYPINGVWEAQTQPLQSVSAYAVCLTNTPG